ncbi:hypothetical protein Slin15195_G052410 [Septoria linicola]|uniref:Uncharacterized protein n=1 Tax=Septoria linicola TaxID=215465 RepID=A0A9Q9AM12_9PEZI|nr:hypothetical protein Slin14017_G127890 [Septoria linicola]USW51922.1 hypothetical protein Slin15195_G052410 [Septoria linicola]
MACEHILRTYGCLHFAFITPETDKLPPKIATADQLWNTHTSKHITTNKPCRRPRCSTLTPRKLRARARHCTDNIEGYLSAAINQYIDLGNRYHIVNPHARAENVSEEKCRLAHHQFGIETRLWEEDPFFTHWLELHNKNNAIQQNIESLDAESIATINHCHSLIGKIEGDLQMLVEGVRELEAYWKWHRDWIKELVKPKKAEERAKILQPMRLFEWVVFEKWSLRTQGLGERFFVDGQEEGEQEIAEDP